MIVGFWHMRSLSRGVQKISTTDRTNYEQAVRRSLFQLRVRWGPPRWVFFRNVPIRVKSIFHQSSSQSNKYSNSDWPGIFQSYIDLCFWHMVSDKCLTMNFPYVLHATFHRFPHIFNPAVLYKPKNSGVYSLYIN